MTTPSPINPPRSSRRQRGAAILIMVLILMLGLITLFTFRMDRKAPELEADRKTAMALAQAKEALLGWSTIDGNSGVLNPGRLPCPDQDNDGSSEGAACANPFLGRVPWKTLELDDLRDGAAERIWYVVDANFRTGDGEMNTGVIPVLVFNGKPIVAAVIAPGAVLSALAQNRATTEPPSSSPSNSYLNFLESYTNVSASLTSEALSTTYNDRVLAITPTELFTAITFRMARELAAAYTTLPYTVNDIKIGDLPSKPPLWTNNKWDSAIEDDGGTSKVTPSAITLKFKKCAIVYTITGTSSVTRSTSSC